MTAGAQEAEHHLVGVAKHREQRMAPAPSEQRAAARLKPSRAAVEAPDFAGEHAAASVASEHARQDTTPGSELAAGRRRGRFGEPPGHPAALPAPAVELLGALEVALEGVVQLAGEA